MPNPSPAIRLHGGPPSVKAQVTAGSTVTATLDSIAGVDVCEYVVLSTDETTTPGSFTLTPSGIVGQTVTFMAGGPGTAGILQSKINNGRVGDDVDLAATTATIKWWVPCTGNGLEVGAADEMLESDPVNGTTGITNAAV